MSDGFQFEEFPQWEAMNFSQNCQAWGEWYTTYLSASPWNNTQYLDGDVSTIFNLFISSVPGNWTEPEDWSLAMYYGRVLDWYGFNYNSYLYGNASLEEAEEYGTSVDYDYPHPFKKYLVLYPGDHCKKERCMAIGWTGDMDLIGIGVFTSYYVEAVLATILLFAYSFWRFRQPFPSYKNPTPNEKTPRKRYRLIVGLQESLQDFLDASQLFSIAMLVAAVYLSGRGMQQRNEDPNLDHKVPPKTAIYDMLLSMLASTFSIFPVMMAYTIKRRDPPGSIKHKRRPMWLGMSTLSLIWVLSVMEAFMSLYGNPDYKFGEINSDYSQQNCDWRGSVHYWVGMRAAQALLLFCPLFLVLVTGFLITGFGLSGVVDKPLITRCRHLWRLIIAWISLLAMWGILGFFTWVRHQIDRTVGHLNESNEWRFGQWLALFTWIPFVLHVLHRYMNGTDLEHEQHEQTEEDQQKLSDGTSMSTETPNSPLVTPHGYTAVSTPDKTKTPQAVEEWQTTGW